MSSRLDSMRLLFRPRFAFLRTRHGGGVMSTVVAVQSSEPTGDHPCKEPSVRDPGLSDS
jgi:hypothetical protein